MIAVKVSICVSVRIRSPGRGCAVLEMLNILENSDLRGMGHNTAESIGADACSSVRATCPPSLSSAFVAFDACFWRCPDLAPFQTFFRFSFAPAVD